MYNFTTNTFEAAGNIPAYRKHHSLTSIDGSTAMMSGGYNGNSATHLFNGISKTWTNGPSTLTTRPRLHSGRIRFSNGTFALMIVGGTVKTSEIFTLDTQVRIKMHRQKYFLF